MVAVTKRDGTVKTECVGRIVRKDNYGVLAEIQPAAQASGQTNPTPQTTTTYAKLSSSKCRMRGCQQKAVDRGYCRACAFDEFDD